MMMRLLARQSDESITRASIQTAPSFTGTPYSPAPYTYQSTKLANGITVLTESVGVPTTVQLGIFINSGSRDQSGESSGASLSLKNTHLKTAINTSQTVNYGISQMSGGEFEMDYNRESTYFRANCLSHDVIDVFSMVVDCAFEPKNVVAASVGAYKNEESHKLQGLLGGNETFNDHIHAAAYGKRNLGMPLHGNRANVSHLSAEIIQKFQAAHFTANRVVVSAAGIENHNQFVDLVNEKFGLTQLSERGVTRETATYIGGEVRNLTEANNVHLVLAFQGANHLNSLPLRIAEEVLGKNRKSGRIQRNILNKNVFIDNVQTINANYTETGLFGIKVAGSASHAKDILNVAAKEINELRSITPAELERAKQSLKGSLSRHYSSDWRRLEDRTKSLFYLGSTLQDYAVRIDAVTAEQVQSAVVAALKTPLSFVVRGGEITQLPSYDSISKLFAQ